MWKNLQILLQRTALPYLQVESMLHSALKKGGVDTLTYVSVYTQLFIEVPMMCPAQC